MKIIHRVRQAAKNKEVLLSLGTGDERVAKLVQENPQILSAATLLYIEGTSVGVLHNLGVVAIHIERAIREGNDLYKDPRIPDALANGGRNRIIAALLDCFEELMKHPNYTPSDEVIEIIKWLRNENLAASRE